MAYVLKRLAAAALVVFGTVTLVFLILYALPGDPASLIAGDDAPPAVIARIRIQLGADQPLWAQYLYYLHGLVTGDLGRSFLTGEPVFGRLAAQLPATLELTFLSAGVAIVLGVLLGVLSAVHRGDWIDNLIQTITMTFTSMPEFWRGILLILIFSVWLHWLPAIGNGDLAQLVLPVACMGVGHAGVLTRTVRNNVLEVIEEPFVATLRGKGLLEGAILYRHVLRSALIPVITTFGMLVSQMLGGVVVIETLFARQGLGRIIAESVGSKDIPMIQGAVLFAALLSVTITVLVDLSYRWIDPRITL